MVDRPTPIREPWARSLCPNCGRLSANPVMSLSNGVGTVTHLCERGHIWSVRFVSEVAA